MLFAVFPSWDKVKEGKSALGPLEAREAILGGPLSPSLFLITTCCPGLYSLVSKRFFLGGWLVVFEPPPSNTVSFPFEPAILLEFCSGVFVTGLPFFKSH